jgi:hypothetical protein
MNPEGRETNGSGGNGSGGFEDFGDFIRDREDEFTIDWDEPEFARDPRAGASQGFDRGLIDSIARLVEGISSLAGDALSPDLLSRVEQALRDLLVVLRDLITALIERIDGKKTEEPRIEEIPID